MIINIRLCKADQLNELRAVSMETYRDTFSESNSDILMQQYFSNALSAKKLRLEFETLGSTFYFIYCDHDIAGFLKINVDDAQSDDVHKNYLEIERFYICKKYCRQGLGSILMEFSYELAKKINKPSIWLGVWEGNFPALAFYKAHGFFKIGEHPFDMGGDIQTDLLFQKDL